MRVRSPCRMTAGRCTARACRQTPCSATTADAADRTCSLASLAPALTGRARRAVDLSAAFQPLTIQSEGVAIQRRWGERSSCQPRWGSVGTHFLAAERQLMSTASTRCRRTSARRCAARSGAGGEVAMPVTMLRVLRTDTRLPPVHSIRGTAAEQRRRRAPRTGETAGGTTPSHAGPISAGCPSSRSMVVWRRLERCRRPPASLIRRLVRCARCSCSWIPLQIEFPSCAQWSCAPTQPRVRVIGGPPRVGLTVVVELWSGGCAAATARDQDKSAGGVPYALAAERLATRGHPLAPRRMHEP